MSQARSLPSEGALVAMLENWLDLDEPLRKRLVDIWTRYFAKLDSETAEERQRRLGRRAAAILAQAEGCEPEEPTLPDDDQVIPGLPAGPTSLELVGVDEQLQWLRRDAQRKLLELAGKWDASEFASLTPADRKATLVRELRAWYATAQETSHA